QARHPLLKDPVPLTFRLENEERIVIISGPNAGGKSVCLKTVGLLQYMLQCGLPVPMSENSETGLFHHIFVDIGDEQSIENDLSTYSSHLKNMRFWIERADRHTLFLADELGSGTEPQAGGAIAEAVLESLDRKGAWGVVTTHYTQLKLLAKHHAAMVNGAMLFDKAEMRPLYIFKKGLPGSSFAFEMARQIGLPADVLKAAQAKTGRQHLQFEQELQQIEVEKQQLSQRSREVETADRLLSDTLEKYRKLTAEIEERKSVYIKEAKTQAADIVAQANRRIEQTIREIKEQQAERKETRRLRGQLQADMAAILNEAEGMGGSPAEGAPHPAASHTPKAHTPSDNAAKTAKAAAQPPLEVGSYVRRADGKEVGVIVALKGRKAKVDFDFMRLELPLEQLKPLSAQEARNEAAKQGRVQVHIE
ncbi:MAG: endonuclease MutS2, partial [Bacteroidales bacterium]|nr:endonuclease MutS2 [Bacteroidales bacterium]